MSHRTQITLTDLQYAQLKARSDQSGVGLAELIRRALTAVYGDTGPDDPEQALEESFGVWADRQFDGEAYVEGLRRGMARRLAQ